MQVANASAHLAILVAARYPAVRAGLRAILEGVEDIRVTGETTLADLGDQGLAPFDVLVADLGTQAAEAAEEIDEVLPGVPAVLLGEWDAAAMPQRRGPSAPRGFLGRDASGEEIAAAAHAVHHGLLVFGAGVAALLPLAPAVPVATDTALTERERAVLRLLAEGLPNKTIALRLGISEHTAKFHVGAILSKLGAASRTEAVMAAARRGLLPL